MTLPALLIRAKNSSESLYKYSTDNFRSSEVLNSVIDPKDFNPDILNAVLFHLTNEERIKHKRDILQYSGYLTESSTLHSKQIIKHKFFGHINPYKDKFKTPDDRARFLGVSNPYVSENITEASILNYNDGQQVYVISKGAFSLKQDGPLLTPRTYLSLGEAMMDNWMNSKGHKKNILDKNAIQLGCGSAYFVKEDFNHMPSVIATQNFQLYEKLKRK